MTTDAGIGKMNEQGIRMSRRKGVAMKKEQTLFKPMKTVRVFEEISSKIREYIVSGVLKPGDKLPSERELANQFQVGRMVLREALRILEQSGFIQIKQGSEGGAFVKQIDTTAATRSFEDLIRIGHITIQDLTEARLGLEKVIVDLAVDRMDDRILASIAKNIEEAEQKAERGERPKEENLHFHVLLARATGNQVYEILIRSLMQILSDILSDFNPDKALLRRISFYHRQIHAALEKRDAASAKENIEATLRLVYDPLASIKSAPARPGGTSRRSGASSKE
jgi:GntR family transcriptional repressor for pyruvate dehydrogenase complex